MKANELQIGDYCKCGEITVKITCISEDSANGIDLDALEPIPITKEIILANGFEYNCTCYAYRNSLANPNLELQWYHYERRLKIYSYDSEDKSYYDYCKNRGMHYVHQLQNFLRDCKEFDLAENFKIE